MKDQFLEQVAHCRKTRIRRAMDNTARINRNDIRSYWNRLKTIATGALPSYYEFRRLPMPSMLALKNTSEELALNENKESVRQELQNNATTRKHVQEQVNVWLADKKTKFAEMLGEKYSALAGPAGFIHPVERTTAWFRCKLCQRVAKRLHETAALTFANVCAHQCPAVSKNDSHKGGRWDVEWFEPDHQASETVYLWKSEVTVNSLHHSKQAIAAAKEVLRVCGLDNRQATTVQLGDFGCSILCKSCEGPIVMDALSVVRCAHNFEDGGSPHISSSRSGTARGINTLHWSFLVRPRPSRS